MQKDKPRNVVLFVMTWQRTGGLEAVAQDIGEAFQTLGWRVQVISVFDRRAFRRVGAIEITSLRPWGRFLCSLWSRFAWKSVAAWQVRRALADGGLLICAHAHLLPALAYVPRCSNVCRWGWVYGLEVWGEQAAHWTPLLNRLDRVISISSFTADELIRSGYHQAVSIVPCSIDVKVFTPTRTPEMIRRDEILICGRMSANERYKGHEVLFQSLPLAERLLGRTLSIRVVGTGDDQARLQRLAQQLGVRAHFAGRVPLQDLVEAYQHCGVFCMPSRVDRPACGFWTGEGFGIVYIEAAACGRPVIASTEGGAPETIISGKTGLLVDPRSLEGVARAIAEVLADNSRADEMGRQGRLLVESRFSREQFQQHVQTLSSSI